MAPTPKSSSVPGSGTAATEAEGEETIGAATSAVGSKTNVPPAPTLKLVPSAMALEVVTFSVAAVADAAFADTTFRGATFREWPVACGSCHATRAIEGV